MSGADPLTIALVGAPNVGKTSVFNALTGLAARTGNYPGVTVARAFGEFLAGEVRVIVEDLPGTYGLEPLGPDERLAVARVKGSVGERPDAVLVVIDATVLERSLGLLCCVLEERMPTAVVLTMADELVRRGGRLDPHGLERALGVPVCVVHPGRRPASGRLRALCAGACSWSIPPLRPPRESEEQTGWARSVCAAAGFVMPEPDRRTNRIDAILLHPVVGTLAFAVVVFLFFQAIVTLAAPAQDAITVSCVRLAELVRAGIHVPWLTGLLADGVLGGAGTVLAFLPQIALMSLLLAVLQDSGYLARAAFLMDRVMARAGLEGRAFLALFSSVACAVPGIMATRTLPSARHRIATMVAAPLMTCSARLPVYLLLVGMLVDRRARFGPFPLQGVVLFALYLAGALAAMLAARAVSAVAGARSDPLDGAFFAMELPSYRMPGPRALGLAVWSSAKTFLRKCGTIILAACVVMWVLLTLTVPGMTAPRDRASATIDGSAAAAIGRVVEPAFRPLGFDWRIDVAVLASLTARETFVSTLGQIASAADPEHPERSLARLRAVGGRPLLDPGTIGALIVFFLFALQCASTLVVMRRESGGWRWPAIAFSSMFALAWLGGWLTRALIDALWGLG